MIPPSLSGVCVCGAGASGDRETPVFGTLWLPGLTQNPAETVDDTLQASLLSANLPRARDERV